MLLLSTEVGQAPAVPETQARPAARDAQLTLGAALLPPQAWSWRHVEG